jgi:hypothetical protein
MPFSAEGLFAMNLRAALWPGRSTRVLMFAMLKLLRARKLPSHLTTQRQASLLSLSDRYLNWSMIYHLAGGAAESAVAFGASALFLEFCFARGFLKRFPSS